MSQAWQVEVLGREAVGDAPVVTLVVPGEAVGAVTRRPLEPLAHGR